MYSCLEPKVHSLISKLESIFMLFKQLSVVTLEYQ